MLQAAYIVVHGSGTRYLTHREWKDTVSLALIPLPVLACCSEYLPPGYQSCVKEGSVPGTSTLVVTTRSLMPVWTDSQASSTPSPVTQHHWLCLRMQAMACMNG